MILYTFLTLILMGLFGCGIKGRPLPPENNSVDLKQIQQTQQSTESAEKTDAKKTSTKTRKTQK